MKEIFNSAMVSQRSGSSMFSTSPVLLQQRISTLALAACAFLAVFVAEAFVTPILPSRFTLTGRAPQTDWITFTERVSSDQLQTTILAATTGDNKKTKRKRRRKKPPAVPDQDPVKVSQQETVEGVGRSSSSSEADDEEPEMLTPKDIDVIGDVAKFEFQTDKEMAMGFVADAADTLADDKSVTGSSRSETIPLPDIKEARKRKQMEEELARMEQEKEAQKVKIKRSDKEAFAKLLEQQPFADADESFFEEEKYGTVSALLGERAKPFLSIPFGPLQVGHFIGALVIFLMAFVEYPGFPLTNLPTPLRESLQGGLGTIYAINTVLAIVAAFKAPERGQPVPLWVVKTFSVGGLAYDQLTQLPTLDEIERVKSVKGKRALKNKRK